MNGKNNDSIKESLNISWEVYHVYEVPYGITFLTRNSDGSVGIVRILSIVDNELYDTEAIEINNGAGAIVKSSINGWHDPVDLPENHLTVLKNMFGTNKIYDLNDPKEKNLNIG